MAVTFDLFGTLVSVERPADPAGAVAAELCRRGIAVPEDWDAAFGESHAPRPPDREHSLVAHVRDALAAAGASGIGAGRGDDATGGAGEEVETVGGEGTGIETADGAGGDPSGPVADAVREAFRPEPDAVTTREGATDAVAAAAARGPVGVLSNCSVPGLVECCLERSDVDTGAFDAVTTSVGCGWRKPAPAAFEAVAGALGADASTLVHVGDDPRTDGGVVAVGGEFVPVDDAGLADFPARVEAESWR